MTQLALYRLLSFTTTLLLSLSGASAQAAVCRASPTGTGDGSTWAQAAPLPAALADAACTEIWLAQGSYSQTADAEGFRIARNLALYGGFMGTESTLAERPAPVNASATVLDGENQRRVLRLDGTTPGGHITASTVIDGLSIARGHAAMDAGGGLLCHGPCSPRITHVVFSGNFAAGGGGAIFNRAMSMAPASPTISHSTFSGNRASSGGAIANFAPGAIASPAISHSTFHDNHAATHGGAIYSNGGHLGNSSPVITHSTFSGNTAQEGGALYSLGGGGGISMPQVIASIFWGNTTTTGPQISDIIEASTTVSHSIVEGGFAGTGNLALDPQLGPLQDNGGPTLTRMPGATGSAIDAVDCAATGATTDQRGAARPQGSQCDIGAVERRLGSYPLNVGITGHGTVAGGPALCAATTTATCAFTYTDEGAPLHVTLAATPGTGQAFAGWGGACTGTGATCTVAIDGARSVSARFAPTAGPGPGGAQPIPTLGGGALALLGALLGLLALRRRV
ncbi:hypothetical protein KW843_11745 [Acidovorax sp. sif1233]|uniref:choice-of-anchor Q domain-containing protein n=1 Tax=Acidovorax sp. sif1233 TaxID=2854792 RepID=UPI001C43FD21|nr:choice-of-anchor Q domain-containing protein [Acidovorax sp. sif1233]MBV7455144.1 hypothetical protein [Acidovorax sp. sif1233]